ncbi:MAG: DinB family protein [Chryseolinea sp.]
MSSDIQHIISLLKSTFEKKAWYGSSVKEVLGDISADQATNRIANTHSIIELVGHMTAWRTFVIKKLEGDVDYKVTDDLNFPSPFTWETSLKDLEESQAKLIEAIQKFDSSRLHDLVPHNSYKYSFYGLLHGIIHHDTYHIGQIELIKKSR